MRTTLNLDEDLLKEAQRLSGLSEKTAVVHEGLHALIARESARRLAALAGSERRLRRVRRRRPEKRTLVLVDTSVWVEHFRRGST